MTIYRDDTILVVVVIDVDLIFIIVIVIDVAVVVDIVGIVFVIDVKKPFISRRSFCRFFLPPGPESKMR